MTSKPEVQLQKFAKSWKNGYSRSGGRLCVNTVDDGSTWYTNSYFAAKADSDVRDPLALLMSKFNLEPSPGTYMVNGTVTLEPSCDPPNIQALIRDALARDDSVVPRTQIASRNAFVRTTDDADCAVFDLPSGGYVMVNADYLAYLEDRGVVTWQAVDALKPLAGLNTNGELVALLMPVRF